MAAGALPNSLDGMMICRELTISRPWPNDP